MQPATAPTLTPELIALNNKGVALMGQFDYQAAFDLFAKLVAEQPDWLAAKVNLAIAQLNLNRPGSDDLATAQRLLREVVAADPANLRAHYCLGILLLNGGDIPAALEQFQVVAKTDPSDAFAAYFLARSLFEQDKFAEALTWYRAAVQNNPLLQSAYYGEFQTLQRLGKPDEAKPLLAAFERLAKNPQAEKADIKYTRMGPKAMAATADLNPLPPVQRPAGPVFAEVAPLSLTATLPADSHWAGAIAQPPPTITVCDIDGDGRPDLFISGALLQSGKRLNAVLLRRDHGYELDTQHPLAQVTDVNAVLWGDYDNDGLTDVYFCRRGGNQLWRQTAKGVWQDVTEQTRTAGNGHSTIDGAFFDADHDGDLDLLLVQSDGPTELLINNLDGTFRPIAKDRGLAGDGQPAIGLVAAPLDGDRVADIVVLHEPPPHEVYRNDRLWNYERPSGWDAFRAAPLRAAVAADPEADGQMKLFTLGPDGLLRWSPDDKQAWTGNRLATALLPQPKDHRPVQLAVADILGDGSSAAICTDADGWQAVSLTGDRALLYRAQQPKLLAWSLLVDGPAKGPAVVGFVAGEGPVIWQPGAGRFEFLAVQFTGRRDPGTQVRSNASGIGVRGAARIGSRWAPISTYRTQSGPGQSLQPTAIGLAGAKAADFLSLYWSDGVFEATGSLAAGKLHHVAEQNRIPTSCPLLFVWDGRHYQFVTDCLGVAGLGFAIGPGTYAPVRPWENLLIPADSLAPRGDRLQLKLAEPMEEMTYLDSAALVAFDLPPGWQMTLDERMSVNGPEPTGQPRFYRDELSPAHAVNDRAQDVTELVRTADLRAAPPGPPDSRFIGRNAEHWIELTFSQPLDGHAGRPMLLADGWIEYPYSQTMFAAWQAGADYRAPTIEARGTDGRWQTILPEFGYPAGMPRQISVPLDHLPAGCTQLRIRTNEEIYWDRLAVAWSEPCPAARRRPLALRAADLHFAGFPQRTIGRQRQTTFDYDRRQPIDDVRYLTGFYTRYGSVLELLAATDDAVATIGPGEEIELEFAALPGQLAAGWARRYVLEVHGWCKDTDLFTKDGETVEPLPTRPAASPDGLRRRDELHRRYNTRLEAGR